MYCQIWRNVSRDIVFRILHALCSLLVVLFRSKVTSSRTFVAPRYTWEGQGRRARNLSDGRSSCKIENARFFSWLATKEAGDGMTAAWVGVLVESAVDIGICSISPYTASSQESWMDEDSLTGAMQRDRFLCSSVTTSLSMVGGGVRGIGMCEKKMAKKVECRFGRKGLRYWVYAFLRYVGWGWNMPYIHSHILYM
jgi:hypothetical protein